MLLIKSKIMTTSVNGLTINDMEKASAISINNTPNNRKRQILNDATPMFQPWGDLDVLHMKRDPNPLNVW